MGDSVLKMAFSIHHPPLTLKFEYVTFLTLVWIDFLIDFKFYLFSNIQTHKGFYYISETGGSNDFTNLILLKSVFLSSNYHLEQSYSYSINLEAFTASHKDLVFPDALHSGGQGVLLRGICKSTHEIVMIWYDL